MTSVKKADFVKRFFMCIIAMTFRNENEKKNFI